MLAICLLTADRHERTAVTVTSLVKHNPNLREHLLLHADDASNFNFNFEIAAAAGFQTVIAHRGNQRCGQVPLLRAMWTKAALLGATHILHLENDQESVAPLPTRRDAESIRLYGAKKERGTGPRAWTGTHIMGTKTPIMWYNDGHDWERGEAHWGGQASITETPILLEGIKNAERLKDVSIALRRMNTLRPRENITWHIDLEGTPEHWLGKRSNS